MHKWLPFKLFFCLFLLALIILSPAAFSQHYHSDCNCEDSKEVRKKAERRYLNYSGDKSIHRYYRTTVIRRNEIVNGHVVVNDGDLEIHGVVDGDVLVIGGDVEAFRSAIVNGDITSVDGTVFLYENAKVRGKMLETNWENLSAKNRYSKSYGYGYTPSNYGTLRMPHSDNHVIARYNRVEGAFLGFAVPKELRYRAGNFSSYGFGGYGFETRKFRYQIGVDRWFFDSFKFRTELGVEFHDLTDTKDLWRIDYVENSLSAFFIKKDFHDYFRRRGYSVHFSQNISPFFQVKAEYRRDEYRSLSRSTNWALFAGNRDFRENPSLGDDEGQMRSLYTQLVIDTRDDLPNPHKGVYLNLNAEKSAPNFLGGEFDFERYMAEVQFFVPITFGESLRLRGMAGTSQGYLPLQKNFELGGISTLRGFDYKEFSGTRMVLANIEYVVSSGLFRGFLGLDELNFIIFGDAGDVWSGSPAETITESFRPLRIDNLKSAIGIGFSDHDGNIRLNIAKRTDRSDNAIEVFFRLNQPF